MMKMVMTWGVASAAINLASALVFFPELSLIQPLLSALTWLDIFVNNNQSKKKRFVCV